MAWAAPPKESQHALQRITDLELGLAARDFISTNRSHH
jgi:hypothetical protein